ncbi:MAG: 2-C-methyl-D-erythritol 4-phosphate cytidylyltransferase [Sphingobacteriaceae bacterium]
MKYYALIVGGGTGSRMQVQIPKQFLELNGLPVLMHTINAFHQSELKPEILLVLNVDFHEHWEELCKKHQFSVPHTLIKGGQQRFHSVKNGLKTLKGKSIVAIHDAVRPLISPELITQGFKQAAIQGNAVTGIPCKDSVRQLTSSGSVALSRESIYLMQTPQTFKSEVLQKAYEQDYRIDFTDDASVVERMGNKIHILPGETQNIKITYPEDLILAETLLQQRKS